MANTKNTKANVSGLYLVTDRGLQTDNNKIFGKKEYTSPQ